MDRITKALGGRAAEEVFFERITTGASSDLQQATRMARAMIMEYGMSESLGLPTYGSGGSDPFMGRDFGGGRDYSEEAAEAIDQEVITILDDCYQKALTIIRDNREKMVLLAETLLDIETLDRTDFEELMNRPLNGQATEASLPEKTLPEKAVTEVKLPEDDNESLPPDLDLGFGLAG